MKGIDVRKMIIAMLVLLLLGNPAAAAPEEHGLMEVRYQIHFLVAKIGDEEKDRQQLTQGQRQALHTGLGRVNPSWLTRAGCTAKALCRLTIERGVSHTTLPHDMWQAYHDCRMEPVFIGYRGEMLRLPTLAACVQPESKGGWLRVHLSTVRAGFLSATVHYEPVWIALPSGATGVMTDQHLLAKWYGCQTIRMAGEPPFWRRGCENSRHQR